MESSPNMTRLSRYSVLLVFLFSIPTSIVAQLATIRWPTNRPLPTLNPTFFCGHAGQFCCQPDQTSTTPYCRKPYSLSCRSVNQAPPTCEACGSLLNPPCAGNYCAWPLDLTNGICVECGGTDQAACKLNQYECNRGCKPHLTLINKVCRPCGDVGQGSCGEHDHAGSCTGYQDWEPCKPGLGLFNGLCQPCGSLGNPPCAGNYCTYPLDLTNGKCVECGGSDQAACKLNQYECNRGCKQHLTPISGTCRPCGDVGQGSCGQHDHAGACTSYQDWEPCKPGLGILNGICQNCGGEGKSPCTSGCNAGLKTKNGFCTASCSHLNQPPCDDGKCVSPYQSINGICKACGRQGNPPCPSGGCQSPLKVNRGVCAYCGSDGQVPCDGRCNNGERTQNGYCSASCGYERAPPCDGGCRSGMILLSDGLCRNPATCSRNGEPCYVGDSFPGAGPTCCGNPTLLYCRSGYCSP